MVGIQIRLYRRAANPVGSSKSSRAGNQGNVLFGWCGEPVVVLGCGHSALTQHSEPGLRELGEEDPILGGKAEDT